MSDLLNQLEIGIHQAVNNLAWLNGREKRLSRWESEFVTDLSHQLNATLYGYEEPRPLTRQQEEKVAEIYFRYRSRIMELTGTGQ